ncbi:MAG TPA: DUF1573 domain-containing protein, partial [Bacteroidota bacterium]|nr:DUF1573 domain-containing protein [Bacteroidota bacterium]
MNYLSRMVGIFLCAFSISFAQPKLSVDKLDIDFGSVYAGAKKQGHVQLQNIGNDTLRIIAIDPSCGCTTIEKPKEFLLPGQHDAVKIEFNSSGYRAGKTEKHVNITTNDPACPNVSVRFHVLIKEVLELTDHNFWLGEIPLNQSTAKTVSLKNVSGKPITIKNILCSTPMLQAKTSTTTLNDAETINVQITYTPNKATYGIE